MSEYWETGKYCNGKSSVSALRQLYLIAGLLLSLSFLSLCKYLFDSVIEIARMKTISIVNNLR